MVIKMSSEAQLMAYKRYYQNHKVLIDYKRRIYYLENRKKIKDRNNKYYHNYTKLGKKKTRVN